MNENKPMINIAHILQDHRAVIAALDAMIPEIEAIARRMTECLKAGNKILWMGNGGSAADSQHLAAELVGRFTRERAALPSIALTTDTSILTALANDYDFEAVFARQVEALCRPGDTVVGLSTSGNSKNVLAGIRAAQKISAYTVGFSGKDGGKMRDSVNICLLIPSSETARVQEAHILIGHILCDWIESAIMETADY